jgi:hypothetical protein
VACGFLHLDKPGRDSLVYDLMECERGTVDGLVLDFLARTTLHYGDVTRVADGSCRLHPQLARAVVASCRVGQDGLDLHARWLRDALQLAPVYIAHVVTAPNRELQQPLVSPNGVHVVCTRRVTGCYCHADVTQHTARHQTAHPHDGYRPK